jgi:D-arabinose 1-dehydrogenase-like Zn-dependent alcohol dehydrogenase
MAATYKAVEISAPGTFRLVERPIVLPRAGQVRIRVEACGVCHSDAGTIEGQLPGVAYPRVPGHEAIGHIEEIGPGVTTWKVGQRVGVGFFGGEDGTCETCRRGDTAYCQNPIVTGVTSDGGYAEMMIAEARALALIPDELKSEEAAPLVCAGITTFNALRNAGRPGDTVAIQGIGGLGHLGVQYAKKMGFRTVAIGGGPDKQHLATKLGAHVYIDAKAEDAATALQKLGAGHEEELKPESLLVIASFEESIEFFLVVNLRFLFCVARPVVLSDQTADPVRLQKTHEIFKLVVYAPWRLLFMLPQKGTELEEILALDVLQKKFWAGLGEVVQRGRVCGQGLRFL